MKILHVVRQYYPSIGGLESYVRSMAAHQVAQGHVCEILTLNKVFHSDHGVLRGEEIVGPTLVHRVGFIGKRRFFVPLLSPSFLKKYDIIHVHNTDMFFDYCALFGTFFGKTMVATTHGGFFHTKDFSLFKKIYFNLITKFSCKAYKALFAISGNDFKTFEGMNPNLVFMPNAVEPLGDFMTGGEDFMYFGRLAQHKGAENLIRAFAHIFQSGRISSRLHIIGPEWDVKIADLAELVRSLGMDGQILLHGALDDHALERVARSCGYFVSGSLYEGFGMSMIETMAVGMIPFVQPNESFVELVGKAGVGMCVDYTDPEQAAAQILQAFDDLQSADMAALRAQAQGFAALYSWDKLTDETLAVYRRAMDRNDRQAVTA